MICIILHKPVGDGTYQSVMGFSTKGTVSIVDTLGATVICQPGWLPDGSISELSSQIDISQARGNVSQGIRGTIEIVDHDGTQRRSVDILNGNNRFAGWAVSYYVSADGSVPTTPINGAWAFAITSVATNATSITLDVVSRWSLNGATVGFGADNAKVGLVAGGHTVAVPTKATELPDPITFGAPTAWSSGSPAYNGTSETASKLATDASRKAVIGPGPAFFWNCNAGDAARIKASADAGALIVSGGEYVEQATVYGVSGTEFYAVVSQEMYDWQAVDGVVLYATSIAQTAVVGGGASVVGFVDDNGRTVLPQGSQSVSGNSVLSFAPAGATTAGFRSYTLIPSRVAFLASGCTLGTTSISRTGGVPDYQVSYLGSTDSIKTDGTVAAFDTLDSYFDPGSTSSFTIWGRIGGNPSWTEAVVPFKLVPTASVDGFVRFSVETQYKLSLRVGVDDSSTHQIELKDPYTALAYRTLTLGAHQAVTTETHLASNPPLYKRDQAFATVDDINILPDTYLLPLGSGFDVYANLQLCAVRLYGVSNLKFGSSYAVVQPGASPWWSTPYPPQTAALVMLQSIGTSPIQTAPGYSPSAVDWGEYIEPDKTIIETCAALCEEFWTVLAPDGQTSVDGTGAGELIEAPTFAMGALEDVVTEFSIKYDSWNGDYRATAYIAHVDEMFDSTNPTRFYGGWGSDADHDYGQEIWFACRDAWKAHGLKRSASYEAPGVHDAVTLGKMWTATRNGAMRCQWLALQPRYMTFRIREDRPTWWAGSTVFIPQTMAAFQGYDLSAVAGEQLVCTSKSYDPNTMTSTYEVALPPVLATGTTDRIVQSLSGSDPRIVQSLSSSDDRIVQIIEA